MEMKKNRECAGNEEIAYTVSPVASSTCPIRYNSELCIGCSRCVSVCPCDILFPGEKPGDTPIVMYPGECYYCGACVMVCPRQGAISLQHPLMNQAKFREIK